MKKKKQNKRVQQPAYFDKPIPEDVMALARERGYTCVSFPTPDTTFKDYDIYVPHLEYHVYRGFPQFILKNATETRYCTPKESHFIIFNC